MVSLHRIIFLQLEDARMLRGKNLCSICFALFLTISLVAQQNQNDLIVHKTPLFESDNNWGLSTRFIKDLFTDKDGIIWIASSKGLIKYDGTNATVFDSSVNNPYRIHSDDIRKAFEMKNGDLILYSFRSGLQLELLKKGAMQSSKIELSANDKKIDGFLADVSISKDGVIYAAFNTGKSILIYKLIEHQLEFFRAFNFDASILGKKISIAPYDRSVWIAVEGLGVFEHFNRQIKVLDFTTLSESKSIFPNSFFEDNLGNFWLCLEELQDNVFKWDGKAFEKFETPIKEEVAQIIESASGQLLFVAGKYPDAITSTFALIDGEWIDYTSYLETGYVSLFPSNDLSKSFFVRTKNNVLNISFTNNKITNYLNQSLTNNQWGNIIMGVNEDLYGNIYFIAESDNFYKLEKESKELTRIPIIESNGEELQFGCGMAIHRDSKGQLWFVACDRERRGILINYNPGSNKFNFVFHKHLIRGIHIDENDVIWTVHNNEQVEVGVLTSYNIATKEITDIPLSAAFVEPRFCYSNNIDSTLWIGTMKGLISVNKTTYEMKTYNVENSFLKSDRIISMLDHDGNKLLTGTFGDGLQIIDFENKNATLIGKEAGLSNNFVCGIIPIDKSNYWLSTFNGLSFCNIEDKTVIEYGEANGFAHYEFNRHAYFQASDSTNYLGSVNGASSFLTKDLLPEKSNASIGISSIKKYYGKKDTIEVLKGSHENFDQIVLSPDVTYLEIDFFQTNFNGSQQPKLYTRLTPYDDNWEYAGEHKRVRYRLLPPGTYDLEVKNQFSTQIKKLKIISETPFYKQIWFPIAVVLGSALFFYGLYRNRIKKVKAEDKANQEINKKFAALELQALQSQLNPHFIFNALGAIQYAIRENDNQRAEHFLTSFASLMRLFLESSKKKHISVAEEIELISKYVELEQLRFNNRFDFEFNIDEKIDIYNTEIPSLLFQPFVENAINHGLFHKKNQGLLQINIQIEDDKSLHCIIEDNGIGRVKSAEIKKRSINNHVSRSTQIVNERIEILQKVEDLDLNIEIQDLLEGTRVVLDIPIQSD